MRLWVRMQTQPGTTWGGGVYRASAVQLLSITVLEWEICGEWIILHEFEERVERAPLTSDIFFSHKHLWRNAIVRVKKLKCLLTDCVVPHNVWSSAKLSVCESYSFTDSITGCKWPGPTNNKATGDVSSCCRSGNHTEQHVGPVVGHESGSHATGDQQQ